MMKIMDKKDEIIMELVHYFVTVEGYSPINVQGAKNEIWLENLNNYYRIIRINSKYIHNDEQLNVDILKMKYVIKQIKRKTLSLKMKVLNICLDMADRVNDNEDNIIDTISITNKKDLKNNILFTKYFPSIMDIDFNKKDDLEEIIKITDDINNKTLEENEKFEKIFKPKKTIVAKILIAINLLIYVFTIIYGDKLILLFGNNRELVLNNGYYRLLTSMFLHGGIIHLACNMYSLFIIGEEVENYLGKWKFLVIYILSGIMGSLLSIVCNGSAFSIGASGAIFGLMGSLLYFGYHYRLYLSGALKNQIIPVIVLNLLLGFSISGIDNMAHIGGLIGGYLTTMIVGIEYNSTKRDMINGIIVYLLLFIFLFGVLFKLV